ncbi:MAG TPA: mechanosensitive ion channel domain-containing protein [Candidatus Dormibacteraeota bacterium]|nr:mechanosensitive ion channel domain-containing protein [Candidatus Dormibacteraeota bacterium]
MIGAAIGGSLIQVPDPNNTTALIYLVVGFGVLVAFVVAARVIGRMTGDQMRKRHLHTDLIVITRRVVTVIVIVIGLFWAFGFALQNSNLPLLGILLATVVAAFGVQDLLKDYVSGYYVLLERHMRVGDRITIDTLSGTITEVRLRVTLLKSDAGDLIVVPNSELFNKSVTVHVAAVERVAETKEEAREAAKPTPPE